jgi:hypothetical protein
MRPLILNPHRTRMAILGRFALTLILAVPTSCVTSDDTDAESETSQAVVTQSFTSTCQNGSYTLGLEMGPGSVSVYTKSARASSCTRNDGSQDSTSSHVHWSGKCFNDLSNRNGVITCAGG